jgi:hypothetical protein
LTLDVWLGLAVEERLVGRPMPIYAGLADSAPISGVNPLALVTAPNDVVYAVAMYDDGAHGDGAAGDGFYAGTFYNTHVWGSYDVVVTASGTAGSGPFVRRQRISFSMLESRDLDDPNIDPNKDPNKNTTDPMRPDIDSDDDGLPDWWEEEHGLDPNSNDAGGDPDHDGLTNSDEYGHGTDPNHSDTDGGGQNDGSEVTTPTNPLDPSDDLVSCPRFFQAEAAYHDRDEHVDAGAVVLYYDVAAEHRTVHIWRSVSAEGPLPPLVLDAPATGIYSDTTAVLDTTYFYWLSANNEQGRASCILGPEEFMLTEDPIEPEGVVMINDGDLATDSLNVTLTLNAGPQRSRLQRDRGVGAIRRGKAMDARAAGQSRQRLCALPRCRSQCLRTGVRHD